MGIRKFSLANSNNATWQLTDPNFKAFATSPTGLGFASDPSFMRVGNDNIITYSQYSMGEKTFDIMFYGDTRAREYQMYNDFIKFLVYEPIYLLYETPNSKTTYRMKVKVMSLGKTEISPSNSALTCPITLAPLSFWEDNVANVITVTNTAQVGGKSYPLTRPYEYAELDTNNIAITCNGTLDSPMQITIVGRAVDPQFNVYDGNDVMYGAGKLSGTYDYVYINSEEADESIQLTRNSVDISNPYNYQDLTLDAEQVTFVRLKALSTNRMAFSLSSGFSGYVQIAWRNRYLSV